MSGRARGWKLQRCTTQSAEPFAEPFASCGLQEGGGGLTQFQLLEESGPGTQLTPGPLSKGTQMMLQYAPRLLLLSFRWGPDPD